MPDKGVHVIAYGVGNGSGGINRSLFSSSALVLLAHLFGKGVSSGLLFGGLLFGSLLRSSALILLAHLFGKGVSSGFFFSSRIKRSLPVSSVLGVLGHLRIVLLLG